MNRHEKLKELKELKDTVTLENNIILTTKEYSNILYSNEFYIFMKTVYDYKTTNLHAVSEFVDMKIADLAEF